MTKKKILKEFTLTEISAVDNPAQPTAKATIMKRHEVNPNELNKTEEVLNMTEEEIAKKVADEVAKATEELTKQATELQLLADMNDADKEVYKAMTDEEKAEWAKLTPEERKKKKEDVAKRNETVEFEGKTVSKSVVGDETFEVIKSLAKKFEENEARVAKAEADAEMATLEKRASEEFKNIAGTPTEIAAVLKGLKSLPEEVATRIEGYMVAVNKSAADDFEVKGTKTVSKSADAFNAKVEEIAKRDGIKKSQAFLIAAKEHPELTQKD